MLRDDLKINIPSQFKCPISLDVMKSPVSLSTGVTYDRSSIQRWLDSGHHTCPATMQVLQNKELVPNHTLQRLITIWSDSLPTRQLTESSSSSNSLSPTQALSLAHQLTRLNLDKIDENSFKLVAKLTSFALESSRNRKLLAQADTLIENLLQIVSKHVNKIYFVEKLVQLSAIIVEDYEDKQKLQQYIVQNEQLFQRAILIILQNGSLDSKVAVARILETLSLDVTSKILSEFIAIVDLCKSDNAVETALSCLASAALRRKHIRPRLVQLKAVQMISRVLQNADASVSTVERAMKILETLTTCKEGRGEICEDEECVGAIVRKLLKGSGKATEDGVTILWSLCCLFRDTGAQGKVIKSNGLGKILLLMQSDCSQGVRGMCGDLLKIFRVNSRACVSSYETKTTHIMPF